MHYQDDDEDAEADDGANWRYYVRVSTKNYGRKEIEYERGERSEITVQFVEPATLEVTIAGYVGSGREGAVELSLAKADSGERESHGVHSSREQKIDAQGRQVFGPVEPGAYEIVVTAKTERFSSIPIDRIPITLRAGRNVATVGIPELYNLTVIVPDPPPRARLRLQPVPRRPGWWGTNETVNKEGRAEFSNLPAGEYKLQMSGPTMGGIMHISIPAHREVRFEPKPINALEVTIEDPEGELAKAGFQTADIIIGVNGTQFKDMFQLQSAFMGAMSKGPATLLVSRGGRELELKLDLRKMMEDRGGMGGELEPTSR
jgi:hypothetical protein